MLNLSQFFKACSPAYRLDLSKPEDRKYYVDFSSVRGGNLLQELKRTITYSVDEPTVQLLTGHIGCGKTTELLRLKYELEQQNFHVIYFNSSEDLDMADVDISDILMAITRQISQNIEASGIYLKLTRFRKLIQGAASLLYADITGVNSSNLSLVDAGFDSRKGRFSLSFNIKKITSEARDSRDIRVLLRQHLEPRVNQIIEALNQELIQPAQHQLKLRGKAGLVLLVDNFDRFSNTPKISTRTQPEYIFIDRGEQLNKLKCHVIYTIPLILTFSNDKEILSNRFGSPAKLLPMVRVMERKGGPCEQGIDLLRQMVLARAFPDIEPQKRVSLISEIFDQPETLDRLCQVSGGHVRSLLILLSNCIQKDDPPFSKNLIERIISERSNELSKAVAPNEWELMKQVVKQKEVRGEREYQILLQSFFVFEYYDRDSGGWFDINPILAESKELSGIFELQKQQERLKKSIAVIQQFLQNSGAIIKIEKTNTIQIQSISSQLTLYAPLPVMFAECPIEKDVVELQDYANQLRQNSQPQVGLFLYQKQVDSLFRIRMAEVRLRDRFVVIPIPFAAAEQALIDQATSTGLLAQYVSRYLPGANLFDDRNAIGDTLSFYGRGNLLHSLEEDLRRCQGIGLFGLRKSGKTSVLLQLECSMREHPVVYIDLQPYGGKLHYGAELFHAIIQKLITKLQGNTTEWKQNLTWYERDRPAKEVATNFTKHIGQLSNLLANSGYKVPIICFLDEVERILPTQEDSKERVEEFNTFFGTFRELSQTQKRLSLLVADVHPDFNRINHWSQVGVPTNPVFNFFKEVFISPFPQQDTVTMLTEIGQLMGVIFDDEILSKIHQDSGGHPFMARQFASLLYQKIDRDNQEEEKQISRQKAQRYLDKPFRYSDTIRDYFKENIWADIQKRNFNAAQAILKLIACNSSLSEGINEDVILERLQDDFSESECESALLWLEKVGLILRNPQEDIDYYLMNVKLMSKWLLREMKQEEIQQWTLH